MQSFLDPPGVVRPVEHGLPLFSPALEVAPFAVVPNGGHVPRDRAPASNLTGVVGASPADVVAAIPLKPPARILPVNPAVATPDGERLRRIYAKTVQARIVPLLPESPFLYDAEDVSTQHLRYFVAELVRETALEQLEDEVPYSVAVEIEEFREDRSPVYIRAVVYLERESQKRIFIGAGGTKIREIGKAARHKVEQLIGAPAYLDLWVKVLPNWRKNPTALTRLGYTVPQDQRR